MDPIRYAIDLSGHRQHLVRVTLMLPDDAERIVLPVWTPGSYVVRDYVHHVQQVRAADDRGTEVGVRSDGHTAWLVSPDAATFTLELYANELTVRSNHVDDHHALLVGAATFPFVDGARDRPHEVTVDAPDGWHVWSLLPGDDRFTATDYDHLVDSAFEAGAHPETSFEVAGVPHRFVWAGHSGRPDLDRIAEDIRAVAEKAVELFEGDLPIEAYTFLCTAWDRGGGGLEHRDGSVLMVPATTFSTADRYRSFLELVAHEYLHLWNVKRLVPVELVELDLERPTHTPSLWVAEGWTAYYDDLLPLRAGAWGPRRHLDRAAERWRSSLETPGRKLQSVRQASHDAWTRYYVRDENSPNATVNYYAHGANLAWCLDLLVRRAEPTGDGLDDVLRLLWGRFGRTGKGYTEADVETAASEVAGTDLSEFFDDHVAGTDDPPLEELLEVIGLALAEDPDGGDDPPAPHLGAQTEESDEGVRFTAVLRDGPAWRGGVTGGDRLVAIDRQRVERGELDAVLRQHAAGVTVELAVLRGPRLLLLPVTLGEPAPRRRIGAVDDPSEDQRTAFERWSGTSIDDVA
ncbi:MAG: PDZ domain-containing protein [Actinobacteria bacterium]|nr:PDZ domain-containing protein [Actinomycetota bacterium]